MVDDGGLFSWKVWKIQKSKSIISGKNSIYDKIRKPLPEPKNFKWVCDEKTHEWSLMPKEKQEQRMIHSSNFSCEKRDLQDQFGHVFEHIILPNDTFTGLCLQYKTTATKIRQLNNFSGSNLKLAPAKLLIPVTRKNRHRVRPQDRLSHEFLIHFLLAEVPELRCRRSAIAYLDLNEWDSTKAIKEASSDLRWEDEEIKLRLIKSSQKQKKVVTSGKSTNTNKYKEVIEPCILGFQKALRIILEDADALSSGKEEWIEMKDFSASKKSPCAAGYCVSETSSSALEKSGQSRENGLIPLDEGQYMVQCRVSADSSISINQIVKNLSDTLPSNFDLLKTKVSDLFQQNDYTQNMGRSVEMQCLIGEKEKTH